MSKIKIIAFLFCIYAIYCQEVKLEGKAFLSGIESSQAQELSFPTKIAKISFSHSSTNPKDYLLGVFQGANDKTFFDAITLYMIKDELEPNKLYSIPISINRKFQFIRYVKPDEKSLSISKFEVYGNIQSIEEESDHYYQPTNLPLLIINSQNGEMPQGQDKVTKVRINLMIINEGNINVKQSGTIKLRGNSSLNSEKKPYLINFDERTTFLDMPCNEEKWTLVPNMFDKSLLRNIVAYKISSLFGLKYTPSCRFVDLILNGNYRGNYIICDKIEVKKDRVNITTMDKTCVEEPEISGGYLIQGTGGKIGGGDEVFITAKGIILSYEYPSVNHIVEEQKTYIKNKINEIEAKCYEDNVENIDIESFSRYFLVEDFSANQDAILNSFFFYKERGDDKIYFGPVWDFDLAFDNSIILFPSNEKKNFNYKFSPTDGTAYKLVNHILSNDVILKKVKETWAEMTNTVFTKEVILDFIDEKSKYINESQRLNYIKWDVLKIRQFIEPRCRGSFEAEVEYLKEFIAERFDVFGEIVKNATKESIINETKISSGFTFGSEDNPWNAGNSQFIRNNLIDEDDQCEEANPWSPSVGNKPWDKRNKRNKKHPNRKNIWGIYNNNNE